jgi:hypothetical protein
VDVAEVDRSFAIALRESPYDHHALTLAQRLFEVGAQAGFVAVAVLILLPGAIFRL